MLPRCPKRTLLLSLDVLLAMAVVAQEDDTLDTDLAEDTATVLSGPMTGQEHDTVQAQSLELVGAPVDSLTGFFAQPTYRFSIGASFDFVEKFKPHDVYGDLMIDLPEALRSRRAVSGFMGGIYQVRSISIDSFIPEQAYLVSSEPIEEERSSGPSDTTLIQLSTATGTQRTVADHLCFFASLYRPWRNTISNHGGAGLYHLYWFDLVRTREHVTERYTRTTNDTVYYGTAEGLPMLPLDRAYERRYSTWRLGFGEMLRHELDDLALQIHGVVNCAPTTLTFGYLLAFRAVGYRSGLMAGAEVRADRFDSEQFFNIYLAKTFKLADMARLMTTY